jgi:two-component system response regulator FixJ
VEDPVEAVSDTPGTGSARCRTVAVVDGDEAVRHSLELLLGSLHLRVETFVSGETFLSAVEGLSPDCVITEVFLPGMSGIDLLRELAARGRAVPAIVMATHADIPLAVEAMHLGALDFVEKPVIDRVILTRVREALRN